VHQFVPGLVASVGVFAVLTLYVLYSAKWAVGPGKVLGPTTAAIGAEFMSRFLLPFEAASILLLVALIGAAMIVRRRKDA
jgi:NADH-quinone oxidoreductase subunit J